ncbi:MAG: hypothetical protein KDA21_15550, partial [Phycisphaerales bacterium]|nr:hypothetical protein [Phycisphaerales bacterium]
TIEMARKIQCPKKGGGTYSLSEKDNWRHYPWSMLRSRCVAEVARRCSPGRLLGLYDPDEIDDIADRPAPRKFSTTTNVSPLNADLPEATTQQEPEPAATPTPESRGPVSNFERCMEATGLPRKEASAMVHNYISTNPVPLDADGEPTDEAMPMLLAELRKMRAEAAAAEATEPLWGGE